MSSDRPTSSSMLRAFEIKQYLRDTAEHSQIVLEVQEQSYSNDNAQASPEALNKESNDIRAYLEHVRKTPGVNEAFLEPLSFSHSHEAVTSDAQTCRPCESLKSACCEVGAVMCVFPDALQHLIFTITTSSDVEQAGTASMGVNPEAEGYHSVNTSGDEKELHLLYNSALWASILGVLTSDQPASIRLFVGGIEISLETFIQRLKKFSSRPESRAQNEPVECGPLRAICQLDNLGEHIPVWKRGLIVAQEDMNFVVGAKYDTFPRSRRRNARSHLPSRSEDSTPRGGTPGSVPRYVPK